MKRIYIFGLDGLHLLRHLTLLVLAVGGLLMATVTRSPVGRIFYIASALAVVVLAFVNEKCYRVNALHGGRSKLFPLKRLLEAVAAILYVVGLLVSLAGSTSNGGANMIF